MDFVDFFLITLLCLLSFLFGVNQGRRKYKEKSDSEGQEYKKVESFFEKSDDEEAFKGIDLEKGKETERIKKD